MVKYELVEKVEKEIEKFRVTIVADSNDADYITTISYYSKEAFEGYILNGLTVLRLNHTGSHKLKDFNNHFDLDIPHDGYDDYCHTLEELSVEYIDFSCKVWTVLF